MRQTNSDQVPAVAPVPPISPKAPVQVYVGPNDENPLHQLDMLQERAMKLELRVADMSARTAQLQEERQSLKGQDRQIADQRYQTAQHDLAAASIELRSVQQRIGQLERLVIPTSAPPGALTLQPPPDPTDLRSDQVMQIVGGAGMLLIPIVLALTWKILRRGRNTAMADLESSPRLQRMEQAIEAIALEVERIGEAQRFSTKLLSERQPDAIPNRAAAAPVPRAITPH